MDQTRASKLAQNYKSSSQRCPPKRGLIKIRIIKTVFQQSSNTSHANAVLTEEGNSEHTPNKTSPTRRYTMDS